MILSALAMAAVVQPPVPADAEPLPPELQAMVEDAIANGSDAEIAAIIRFVRRAYPAQGAALDEQVNDRTTRLATMRRERLEAAGPLDNWHGRAEVGASLTTGNSDNLGVYASVELKREGLSWNHQFRASANVQETNGIRTQEQLNAAYEPRYTINDRLYAYGLVQAERDPFLGYESRFGVSAGIGYALVRQRDITVNVQGGPAYRFEDTTTAEPEGGPGGRAALDARWQIRPGVVMTQAATAFVDFQGNSFTSATGLEAQLIGRLSARVSYNVQYEDRPLINLTASTNTQSRVSLVYGF